jgi:hypothetical protein
MVGLTIVLACVTVFLAVNFHLRARDARTAGSRSRYCLDDFLDHFSKDEIPKHMLVEVYRYFQSLRGAKDLAVRPDDDLYQVYGVWNEDLDDAIIELARKCRCKAPTNAAVTGVPPVRSVEDIVRLLVRLDER